MDERTMKVGLAAVLLCSLLVCSARAQSPEDRPGFLKYDIEQEVTIRKQFEEFSAAWNRHDTKAMVSFYALDADYVSSDLQIVRGRDQIEKLFEAEHATVFKESKLSFAIDSVWLVTENVALVDGSYTTTGVKGADGKNLPTSTGHLTGLLLKERDRWWVVASRAMLPIPPTWRADFEKLTKDKAKQK